MKKVKSMLIIIISCIYCMILPYNIEKRKNIYFLNDYKKNKNKNKN